MYIYNSAVIYTPIRFNLLLASYINLFKKLFVLWNMFLDLQTFFCRYRFSSDLAKLADARKLK